MCPAKMFRLIASRQGLEPRQRKADWVGHLVRAEARGIKDAICLPRSASRLLIQSGVLR